MHQYYFSNNNLLGVGDMTYNLYHGIPFSFFNGDTIISRHYKTIMETMDVFIGSK